MNSELQLVERAKKGDRKAFEQLIKENQNKIYNLGLKLLGNREDAADLLQETFTKAYESLLTFQGKSSFSTWLYRIATNFALMKLRKEKRKKISINEIKHISDGLHRREILDWSWNPQSYFKNEELKAYLKDSIESLPPKYKTVFILHDIEGRSVAEVGQILSLSTPAVKSRIHRSRLFLREKLSNFLKENEKRM